jgi:hypothetical protein
VAATCLAIISPVVPWLPFVGVITTDFMDGFLNQNLHVAGPAIFAVHVIVVWRLLGHARLDRTLFAGWTVIGSFSAVIAGGWWPQAPP